MRAQLSTHDYEQISAYLDGQLSSREKARFEQNLRERTELKTAFDEMSRTRALLRMAPRRRAPRNFTLTPAMVQQDKPRRSFGFNLFPALSFASAMAALLLIATVLFELMPGVSPAASTMDGAAPEAARVEQTNDLFQQSAPAAESEAGGLKAAPELATAPAGQATVPPVINWGAPSNNPSSGNILGQGGGPGLEAIGRGGGGGYDPKGLGGGAPDGNLVVPLESVPSVTEDSTTGELSSQQDFSGVPPLEGAGPILGLPSAEQSGEYTAPLATPLPERELRSQNEDTASDQAVSTVPVLRWVQILLGVVALITGLAAFMIWRRTR